MDFLKSLSSKPEKFDGKNFLCWQQKIKFWLTELGLFSVILNGLKENDTTKESSDKIDDLADKDILCHGRILSALSDSIYRIFSHTKSALELWNALDYRYGTAEKGLKRVSIDDWLDFQMVDTKSVSDQLIEFENLIYDMKAKGVEQSDCLCVFSRLKNCPHLPSILLEVLSISHENFSLEELFVALRIEDRHRSSQQSKKQFFKPRP
ncbi:hypothetical protein DH2020_030602 [Rehmannia glutinosa]|uniref:Uncharacterized protein n=1 Tax=Rehmannia glutinosa TaxID=99300 RepID=A0ABR0VKC1_REHGL